MSGGTVYERPRRHVAPKMRVHDYLYDSAFIVSGAKDYARTAFRAAMASAQLVIQPVYKAMFSDSRMYPSVHVVYHANCRLPGHLDRSYGGYLRRVQQSGAVPPPELTGKDRFKYTAMPKKVLATHQTSPDFHPPSPQPPQGPFKPRNRGTQSIFRESSAQTIPWQPDAQQAEGCENTPEVLYLDKLLWGPGKPYRTGDLPADFHTTEIINKMRHARKWNDIVEKGDYPRWMKKRDAIITDVETKDWIFREAEIDELQDIRLTLLHRIQQEQRQKQTNRTSLKLAKLWATKKQEMERKVDHIRRGRDRELRKLTDLHTGGGRVGLVQRMRASRGGGPMIEAAHDPTSDLHAPLARHGYQARRRHAEIAYDPSLLSIEDHERIAAPPAWLEQCGQNLKRTCSGHHLPADPTQLCERETKWSEQFLESLHEHLKKARLGAALTTAGPLHVLKPRRVATTPRPPTPEVDAVKEEEENNHQAALLLQKVLRGRAVQILMYEGRTRAAELTEELKTTHGLQKEDKIRIAREETKAREYNARRTETEQKDDAVSALVDELCGGAVSAALDFLEKELKRLKEERRQHAFILIAMREKGMREAAEAGRRQKEEHRRREHDEMFKQVLGVTQETVDAYLQEVITEGVELAAEEDAVKRALAQADSTDASLREHDSMSTAEQNELVAELVQQFLLPSVHKTAARHHISALQQARLEAARKTIFGLLDDAEVKEPFCIQCGTPLGETCRCRVCPIEQQPTETTARDDQRWRHTRIVSLQTDSSQRPHRRFTRSRIIISHSESTAEHRPPPLSATKSGCGLFAANGFPQPSPGHRSRSRILYSNYINSQMLFCIQCGTPLGESCRCRVCPIDQQPTETTARDDQQWRHTRTRPAPPEKPIGERFPPAHDFRNMLDVLVDEVVTYSRAAKSERQSVTRDLSQRVKERLEAQLDAQCFVEEIFDRATDAYEEEYHPKYHHYMKRIIGEALERSVPFHKETCPKELPSEIRRRIEEEAALYDHSCKCDVEKLSQIQMITATLEEGREQGTLLPSEVRVLEDLRRCKCDTSPTPSPEMYENDYQTDDATEVTSPDMMAPGDQPPDGQ